MMHPKGGIPPPQGGSDTVEQMFGAGSRVLWANPPGNGLPKRPDDVDGVLRQTSQRLRHDGDELHPCRLALSEM